MALEADDLLRSFSFSSLPSQPISIVSIEDPAYALIYNEVAGISDLLDLAANEGDSPANVSDHFTFFGYQQSPTLNPTLTDSVIYDERQVSPLTQKRIFQVDESESKQIKIKYPLRPKFRPRMEKESEDSSHYLHCEDNSPSKYPVIHVCRSWAKTDSIIQVTLVGIDRKPHPYTLENKERKTSPLVFKNETEPHTLYFRLVNKDYEDGQKMFLIEYIKSKQDHVITKALIKERQLHQSMLRFKRLYRVGNGPYQADEDSTVFSCVMTEDYGKITIVDLFPLFGPMTGNQKVCVELKGCLPKDWNSKLVVRISRDDIHWTSEITDIKHIGKHITFSMPPFPYSGLHHVPVNILIEYEKRSVYQATYIYSQTIDDAIRASVVLLPDSTIQIHDEHPRVKRARQCDQ